MPDQKQKCRSCKQRHLHSSGKKCQLVNEKDANTEFLRDAAIASGATESQMMPGGFIDGQLVQILEQLKRVTERIDQVENRMAASTHHSTHSHGLSRDSFF